MFCNCHGYALGVEAWVLHPELVLEDEHYFTPVTAGFQRGDIIGFLGTLGGEYEHTAVITGPATNLLNAKVRHMPGLVSTRSLESTVQNAWTLLANHELRVFRPNPAVRGGL